MENKGDINSQWGHSNYYCPNCKATGKSAHEKGCICSKIRVSATARFPKKKASEKIWNKFYRKFVLQEDLKQFKKDNEKI